MIRFPLPSVLTAISVILSAASNLQGQLPGTRLDAVFPPGAGVGKTLDVTISGADLDDVDRLLFSHPGITATRKMSDPGPFDQGPQPVENQFVVTVKSNVPVGTYNVRSQGKYGLSNPRSFVVDTLIESVEAEPNNTTDQATDAAIPGVVNGQLNGGADVDWYRFKGTAGQPLLIDAFARRIDSRSDVVITLATADGRILAENRQGHAGDPLIDLKLPANGDYFVRVQDSLYAGGVDFVYRLVLSARPHIDFVFPPAGIAGSNEEYIVYGRNLPGGKPSGVQLRGQGLQQLKVRIPVPANIADKLTFGSRLDPHQAGLDGWEYRISSPTGRSNPVLMTVATAPIVREQTDNERPAQAQKLTLPCEIVGQFFPKRDMDWYTFDAKAGEVFSIEVYSHRLGIPTDPGLLVQQVTKSEAGEEKVSQMAWIDDVTTNVRGKEFDHRSNDPWYKFTAPADGIYRILVRDSHSAVTSDPRLVYRLAVRPLTPDFRLAAAPVDLAGAILLRKGGRQAIRVTAFRQDGYDGEIRVSATGLPKGVTTSEIIIGPGSSYSMLVLSAADNAAGSTGSLQIVGKGKVNKADVTRIARVGRPLQAIRFQQPNSNVASLSSRLTDRLQVTVSDTEKSLISLTAGDGKVIETSRGGVIKIPFTAKRADGVGGNVTAFPFGLPPNVSAPQVGIGGNPKGECSLRLQATTPPGTYTFYLATMVQGIQYSRNPEAAERAKKRKEELAKILTEANKKSQTSAQTAQKATNALNQANSALTAAKAAKATADKTAADAATALKAATAALNTVKQQSAAKADDAALKQQVVAAQNAVNAATQKRKTTTATATASAKTLADTTTKQKVAQDAKTTADQESQDAKQFAQAAQQAKLRADQKAQQTQQQSNKRGINVNVPSTPVTIKIAEFPITHTGAGTASVKQSESVDVAFNITRLFDFKAAVSIQPQLPGGVGGLQIPNVNIAANQTTGTIKITAAANATPGEHAMKLRLQMNFNGQNLILEHPLKLTVVKVEPAKK